MTPQYRPIGQMGLMILIRRHRTCRAEGGKRRPRTPASQAAPGDAPCGERVRMARCTRTVSKHCARADCVTTFPATAIIATSRFQVAR